MLVDYVVKLFLTADRLYKVSSSQCSSTSQGQNPILLTGIFLPVIIKISLF